MKLAIRPKHLRVMLVFADPHQRVIPIPPYGLERIATAIADLDCETVIEDPFLFDDAHENAAAELAAHVRVFNPDVIGLSIRNIDDCQVISNLEDGDEWVTTNFLPLLRPIRDAIVEAAPNTLLIAGGAAFSMMPGPIMEALDLPLGIVGSGEAAFRLLIQRLAAGQEMGELPGLVHQGETAPLSKLAFDFLSRPTIRDPRYTPASLFAVRTRFGCGMKCSYCLLANYERRQANGPLETILTEVEETVALGLAHGLPRVAIMFSDEEFNLPDEHHPLAILHGIEDRGLVQNILWRAYFNPVPISDELAMMIGRTNGYASITFDSASDTVLARNGKSFRRKDLQPLIDRCLARGVQPSLGFLFGLPGETEKTLEETITFIRDIPQELDVNYECGLRVYPGTPLEAMARADPIHVVEAGPEPLDIRIYCAPRRPRDLTRYLREAFADRPNVRPTGPAYRSGSRINSTAYRLVRRDDEVGDEWAALLDVCAKQRWPDDYYEAVRGIARWYGRTELDAEATRRLDLVGGLWQPNLSMNEINEQE